MKRDLLRLTEDRLISSYSAVLLFLVGIKCYQTPYALLKSVHVLVEKKQIITTLFAFAEKVLSKEELDERLVELFHVEDSAFLLVNVGYVDDHLLQVCC
jgi:hypothetical protein